MIILNFSHPISARQLETIQQISQTDVSRVIDIKVDFDHQLPFVTQLRQLLTEIELSSEAWQNERILVNPPALNVIAVLLLSELHGRRGNFPEVIRLKPAGGQYEVAELIPLQEVRDEARKQRWLN
jgi:hypothetical protein